MQFMRPVVLTKMLPTSLSFLMAKYKIEEKSQVRCKANGIGLLLFMRARQRAWS